MSTRLKDCGWIILASLACLVLLRPLQDTPFVDDWCYAWPVERFIATGKFQILEWSGHLNLTQIGWGWLFCLPTGFSFTMLRLSTFVLAIGGLCGFYLLLLRLDASGGGRSLHGRIDETAVSSIRPWSGGRAAALLGTAILGFNPVFFLLSFTFMTDVPFLALTIWAVYAFMRAAEEAGWSAISERASAASAPRPGRQRHHGWFLLAVLFAAASVGVRTTGVVLPAAMLGSLVFARWNYKRPVPIGWWLLLLIPFLCAAGLIGWRQRVVFVSADLHWMHDAPAMRLQNLRFAVSSLPAMLVVDVIFTCTVMGLALLPLTLAALGRVSWKRVGGWCAVFALLLGGAYWRSINFHLPLQHKEFWSVFELGLTESMLPRAQTPELPAVAAAIILVVTLFSFAIAAATIEVKQWKNEQWFLALLFVGNFLLIAVLWLFHDRYALVYLPLLVALLLTARIRLRWGLAVAVTGLFGIVALIQTHDHLVYNRAMWQAVALARTDGATDSEIDGGYVVNGWRQYAHPEHAPRDAAGELFIPSMTTGRGGVKYQLSNYPIAGVAIVGRVPYQRWCAPDGAIVVMKHSRN